MVPFGTFCRKTLTFEDFNQEMWFRLEKVHFWYSCISTLSWYFSNKDLWCVSVTVLQVCWIEVDREIINKRENAELESSVINNHFMFISLTEVKGWVNGRYHAYVKQLKYFYLYLLVCLSALDKWMVLR